MTPRVLLLPGLYNSGPQHWQSLWEAANPDFLRVQQDDWDAPALADWVARLDQAVAAAGPEVVLVAHSAACILVASWGAEAGHRVRGALLVAPSDYEAPSAPKGPTGFTPMPKRPLSFPSIVVASSNDQYVTLERAAAFARAWGSRCVVAGALGHINAASQLGDWPVGRRLLDELLAKPSGRA